MVSDHVLIRLLEPHLFGRWDSRLCPCSDVNEIALPYQTWLRVLSSGLISPRILLTSLEILTCFAHSSTQK
jgi:hypothetical protein